jgi:hypothetical protein
MDGKATERLTFERLADLEPRLRALLEEARAHHSDPSPDFCANAVFYGYAHVRQGLKARLLKLVGWESGRHDLLGTSAAYDVAYDTIFEALPDCRGNCACTAIWRALVG